MEREALLFAFEKKLQEIQKQIEATSDSNKEKERVLSEKEKELEELKEIKRLQKETFHFSPEVPPRTPEAKSSGSRSSWLKKCSNLFTFSPVKRVEEPSSSRGSVEEENEIFEGNALSENVEEQSEKITPQKRRGRGRSVKGTMLMMDVMERSNNKIGEDIKDGRGKKRMLEVTTVEETGRKYKKSHTVGSMVETPGEKRYNLRHTTVAASKASKAVTKGFNKSKPAAVNEFKSTSEDGEPNIEATEASADEIVLDRVTEPVIEESVTPTLNVEEREEEEEEEAEEATIFNKVLNFIMR